MRIEMAAHVLPHKLTRIEFTSYAEGKGKI